MPIMAFYDFAAAFPSLFHEWIFLVLRAVGCPLGIINVVEGIYHENHAYIQSEGTLTFLFHILSGALQGCPLSGSLFAIAVDPFLWSIHEKVDAKDKGVTRACADDIGQSLSSISTLKVMAPVFKAAKKVAGLTLNSIKCVIVPLKPFSAECAADVKDWLARNLSEWSSFKIQPTAKYLGFWLGPSVT